MVKKNHHINDLPNEILTKIFQRLESNKDLETVQYVCQRWRAVVNETVGLERFLGRPSIFLSEPFVTTTKYDWYPLDAMLNEGIYKSCISIPNAPFEEDEDIDEIISQSNKYPIFWAPFLVSQLTLYGDISNSYFTRLVSPLINLTELEIHISTLSTLMMEDKKQDKKDCSFLHSYCSKRILTLRLSMKGIQIWHLQTFHPSKMSRYIDNLKLVINGVFPHLQRFELEFPFLPDKDIELTKLLSRFLYTHRNSLKHLSIEYKCFKEVSTTLEMDAYSDIFELTEFFLNLKSFNIDITDKTFIVPSIYYWEKLLLQQKSLEYLKFKSGYYCFLPIIERNCQTLKSIKMTVHANAVFPLDCKLLENCENLETLELDGYIRLVHLIINPRDGPHIINTLCLPQTLTTLRLCNIFIKSEDADHICLGLRHLKSLQMENVGQTNGLGINFSTLCKIFDRKQLNSFKITKAINKTSLENARLDWEQHSTLQSLLMVLLATSLEIPKMVKREDDDCYIAEINVALPILD